LCRVWQLALLGYKMRAQIPDLPDGCRATSEHARVRDLAYVDRDMAI
jgi:hypothetical protein